MKTNFTTIRKTKSTRNLTCLLLFLFFITTSANLFAQNWLVTNGGQSTDEALDITADATGNYYVTGYFTATAKFGSTTLTSSGNGDVFIAKYNAMGVVQWATKAGGVGSDRAYSIKTDDVGNVYITGFYYGTATFGTTTITSVSNTQDVFIAKYDFSGTLLWVRSVGGSASETGYGITADHDGNVIVTGQFKGSATFGTDVLTSIINPSTTLPSFDIFIVKYDKEGNFLWVKQGKAKYDDRGMDLAVDKKNNIFVVGQFSDTITFDLVHNNPVMNSGYLMKYDKNGNEQWFVKMSALQTIVYGIVVDNSDNIIITGDYKGNLGIFTTPIVYNTSAYDNKIFVAKFTNNGNVLWIDNDGSDNEITSKCVTLDYDGNIYIAGLFKCRFDEYSKEYGSGVFYSSGYRDVFVTKYSPTGIRQWFKQYGSNKDDYCSGIAIQTTDKPVIAGSFENVFNVPSSPTFTTYQDNFLYGSYNNVYCSNPNYQAFLGSRSKGQKDIFISSPVDMAQAPFDYFIRTGIFCNQNFIKPCINDCKDTIEVCDHTDIKANVFEIDTNSIAAQYNFLWNTGSNTAYPYSFPKFSYVDKSGLYWVKSEREDGCFQNIDSVQIIIHQYDTVPSGINVTKPHVIFVDSVLQATDTIKVCQGTPIVAYVMDSALYPLNDGFIPYKNIKWNATPNLSIDPRVTTFEMPQTAILPNSTGFYTLYDTIISAPINCTIDTIKYYVERSFYVIILPKPPVLLSITGPNNICPGDTATLYATSNSFDFTWYGTSIVQNFHDSIRVIAPFSVSDTYSIFAYLKDSITGCINSASADYQFNPRPAPVVTISPLDGIICPNDSVLLTCQSGINYYWIGPAGDSIGNTQSIYVDVSGYYHCIHTNFDGCIMTTNFVEAKEYNTPYLQVEPGNVICANGNAIISVQASNSALIQWQSPLSGSAVRQTVTNAGTYICHITQCGITTIDSVVITKSNTVSYITATDSTICPGDTVALIPNPGMVDYYWYPNNVSDQILYVTTPGTYTLRTTDENGCYGFSKSFTINTLPQPLSPIMNDTVVCAGQSITLSTNSSGIINWFDSPTSTIPIHTGNIFTTPIINTNTIYYLQTYDSLCSSRKNDVNINLSIASSFPSIVGNTVLCAGDSLYLKANAIGVNYSWKDPLGNLYNSQNIEIANINSSYQGIFTLQYSDAFCSSSIDTFNLFVNNIPTPYILPDSNIIVCAGGNAILKIDSIYSAYNWFLFGENTQSITVSSGGIYSATVTENGCSGISNSVTVTYDNPVNNPTVNGTIACAGTSATLNASGDGTLIWFDSTLTQIATGSVYNIPSIDSTQLFYVQSTDSVGCVSAFVPAIVNVLQTALPPNIYTNSPICAGDNINLSTDTLPGATYFWTGVNGFSSSSSTPIISNATTINSGTYQLIVSITGCSTPSGASSVTVYPIPSIPSLSGNTIYCEGDSLLLKVTNPQANVNYFWSSPLGTIYSDSSYLSYNPIMLADSGLYNFTVVVNGCYNDTAFNIDVIPKPIALINTLVAFCEGKTIFMSSADSIVGSSYYWTGPNGFVSTNISNAISNSSVSNAGIYTLVTALNGCSSDSTQANIQIIKYPIIDLGNDTSFCNGSNITFTLPNTYSYIWNDGSFANTYTVADSGMVKVIASAGAGCITSDSVLVDNYDCLANVPNIITPNGDGINDRLFFKMEGMTAIDCEVFDRWGNKIYRWTDIDGYWDGHRFKGDMVDDGVYFYTVQIWDMYKNIQKYEGFVQVLK